jgi:hypothetical protein
VAIDLSRYDDWTTWLAERGATDPDVRVVWVGADFDVDHV